MTVGYSVNFGAAVEHPQFESSCQRGAILSRNLERSTGKIMWVMTGWLVLGGDVVFLRIDAAGSHDALAWDSCVMV